MAASALKNPKEVEGGGGDFDVISFNLKVHPTNFMPIFLDNFCPLLVFWGTSPPSPPRGRGPGCYKVILTENSFYAYCSKCYEKQVTLWKFK